MNDVTVIEEGRVRATPEQLWPLIDDPARMGEWFAFADRMEMVEGQGLGRRQRLHGHWGSKRSEIDQEIVAYDPARRLSWRHLAERLDGKPAPRFAAETVFTITLVPEDEGTRVKMVSRQVPASRSRGLVMRLFGGREVAKLLAQSLVALRELAH
ncbi:MAG TPA: SRPBCC family protein [Solirubrobacteraceae bacterium]|nr:SRPBCC family protein [Solirubrobacteraceae bacterium]